MQEFSEQQSRLLQAQLAGVLRQHRRLPDDATIETLQCPLGATALDGGERFLLVAETHERSLGPILLWQASLGVEPLVVLSADPAPLAGLARRAAMLNNPVRIAALSADGSSILSGVDPADPPVLERNVPAIDPDLARSIEQLGAEVIFEGGQQRVEFRGLEVAKLADDGTLSVGVGEMDREISSMTRSDQEPVAALASVIEAIGGVRRKGAALHPMRDLCSERWQRRLAVADPTRVGARSLRPVEMTIARTNLRANLPCAALGEDSDGVARLYVFTSGVDLDLIPQALDAAATHVASGATIDGIVLVGTPGCFPQPVVELCARSVLPMTKLAVEAPWN